MAIDAFTFTSIPIPSVTNITPASGPAAGGTPVTITGTNLTGTTSVTIGGAVATVGTVNATTITATTPPGTAGAKNVVITTPGGTATGVGEFTYLAAPAVTSVSVPANGTYKAGDALNFTVNYDSVVIVTGTPLLSLTLDTGGTVQASYVSGSGSKNLVFSYTVASGNLDADGIAVGSSLALNGGTLKEATNVDASLTLSGVGATTGVKVDAVAPTVASVTVPSNATYVAGQDLDFVTNFSEVVIVSGTPYIPITLNTGGTVSASYMSGSGTAALTFRYTVVTGNYDPDGVAVGSAIAPNGGTIQDSAGNSATNALNSVGSTSAVLVNAFKPTATTGVASSITKTTATLEGTISSNGDSTTATFDYGKTLSYGSTITAAQSPLAPGASGAGVSAAISGLDCNTLYHFRVNGSNTGGTSNGSDVSFTTSACVAGAPTGVSATAGVGQATVTFIAPVSDGGASITGYTVTSSPGSFTGTGTTSPITVTGLTNGTAYTFTVTASNSAGTSLPSLASTAVTPKANQTISFTQPANQSFGATPTLAATSDSSLTVTFTSSTTVVCTITPGGALTFLTTGACTIDADQAGNGTYFAATTVSRTFSVGSVAPSAPTIGTATAGDTQATVAFTAPGFTGGSSITGYTVTSSPGNITGTGSASPITVTGLTNGTAYTFTVTATNGVPLTSSASAASNSVTPRAAQIITFTSPGAKNFGTTPTLSATASSGLTVSFSSSTTSVCTTTSGGALSFAATGTCTINADQAGNGTYLPAATVPRSFSVNAVVPGAPTIGTATAGTTQAAVAFTAPTFTGGASITSYTVTSNPGALTATGTTSPITVTGLTNGTSYTFTVTATNSAGTSTASAASNSVTPKAAQTITFANPGAQSFGTTPTLTATAPGGAVTFSSSTTGVCTVTSGGTLSFVSAGNCTINADQAGSTSYAAAATAPQTFAVNAVAPGAPTIGTATAGNTQATVSFTAPANTGGATISSYTATSSPGGFTGTGTASPITVTGLTNGTAYTFTVTATNNAGTGAASAASTSVTPVLSAPIANASSATVAYGSSANVITPTLGGGTANSLAVTTQPAHGTASVNGLTLLYTPAPTYTGTDTFTYTGTNAGGTSAPATVTVTVNPRAPIAGAVSMKVEIGSANNVVPLALTGGAVASVAVITAPDHGTAAASGTVITYTPAAGYSGNDSFTYTATNAGGTSAPGTVTILVSSRPDPTKDAEVIALLNAQVQTAKRFSQTQIGNFQTRLESLHTRSQALLQEGPNRSSRGGIARTPAESTATSLTEFSSGTNTGTAANSPSALFSPRSTKLGTDARCQAGNMKNCVASSGMRTTGDGMDSLALGALTSANTRSDWWPWPTLSMNGSSKDLLGSGLNVWSAGTVNVGKQSESDTRFTTSGISVGGDNHVTDKLILGVGAGFGHERQKIGSNDTKNRGDSYSIVAYGSYQPEEGFFVDGLLGYGHLAFDAERYVTATGDFAQSERKGSQWFSSLSGGYEYVEGKFLFSPYGRLDLIHTRLDESAESGAGTSDLTYLAQTSRSTKLSLGLRSETTFEIDKGTIKPSLRVEYQHDFAEPGVANMAYSDDLNGTVYQLDMESTDRNTMVLGLGLDFALRKSWQTGLSYKFSHSSSSSSQMQSFGVYLRRAF